MIPKGFLFHPVERFIVKMALCTAALDIFLILHRGTSVDIPAYGFVIGLALVLMAIGWTYRHTGRSEQIGSTATCAGLFIIFTSSLSLFNYLLLPGWQPAIDQWLVKIDSWFGYHWPDAIEWSVRHPFLNEVMRLAYLSTLPQIIVLVIALGLTGQLRALHGMMATVAVSALMTVIVWGVFPSVGPSALFTPAAEALALVRPVVGPAYGAELTALLRDGASWITPREIRGLVAFPSYHVVLACVATCYASKIRWLLPVFATANAAVLPAVIVHGGHHFVDIPGGLLVFLAAIYLVQRSGLDHDRAKPLPQERENLPVRV